jgi:ABC-type polysaccharide/polyol phosphate export permease
MSLRPTSRDWALAWLDLTAGFTSWQVWSLLGFTDIRQRYLRSRFGQFWITLSTAIFIGGIGTVYSVLFRQPIQDYIPYLAVNITVWTLISQTVSESSTAFVSSAIYLRQDAIPKTTFILRLMVRNLITFAHNFVIIPLVFLVFLIPVSTTALLAIPGLLLVLLALFLISLNLGILSTRFRDLPQIITNALQLIFFITPIMWRTDQLSGARLELVTWSPIATLLRIVSEPMLGHVPRPSAYLVSILFIFVLIALTLPLFARFRARLVYWL